jgi:hypothetical protein
MPAVHSVERIPSKHQPTISLELVLKVLAHSDRLLCP